MKTIRIIAGIGALALAAGIGLTACGGSPVAPSVSHTSQPPAAVRTTAPPVASTPATASTPVVNYQRQYLNDVGPYNQAATASKADESWTSPESIAYGQASTAFGRELLQQTWPANAQADIHALAVLSLSVALDIEHQDYDGLQTEEENSTALAQTVRVELGLPQVPKV